MRNCWHSQRSTKVISLLDRLSLPLPPRSKSSRAQVESQRWQAVAILPRGETGLRLKITVKSQWWMFLFQLVNVRLLDPRSHQFKQWIIMKRTFGVLSLRDDTGNPLGQDNVYLDLTRNYLRSLWQIGRSVRPVARIHHLMAMPAEGTDWSFLFTSWTLWLCSRYRKNVINEKWKQNRKSKFQIIINNKFKKINFTRRFGTRKH